MASPGVPHHLLSGLRNSGAHSDLIIKCGDFEFLVHKCIVCPQSTFFEKACEEGRWKEGYTNVIELKAAEGDHPDPVDDDPRAVKLMIDYLHLDDYDPATLAVANSNPPVENGTGVESAIEHAVVDATQTDPPRQDPSSSNTSATPFGTTSNPFGGGPSATPFGAPAQLQQDDVDNAFGFGTNSFRSKKKKGFGKKSRAPAAEPTLDSFLEMHARMFAIATKYDIKSLKQTARDKFNDQFHRDWSTADLIAAMEIVCTHTPDREIELRTSLKDAIVRHAVTLVEQPCFREAVERIDGLAYDLFCRMTNAPKFS